VENNNRLHGPRVLGDQNIPMKGLENVHSTRLTIQILSSTKEEFVLERKKYAKKDKNTL